MISDKISLGCNVIDFLRCRWIWVKHGVKIQASSTIDFPIEIVSKKRGSIVIGAHTSISTNCLFISVDTQTGETFPIRVGSHTIIGANVTVMPSVTVGNNVTIAPGSTVTHDIPDNSYAAGNPARRASDDLKRRGKL